MNQNTSSELNTVWRCLQTQKLRKCQSLAYSWICGPLIMSGILSMGEASYIEYRSGAYSKTALGVKSKPPGMPFPRLTFRACMIQCHDLYGFLSLSVEDTQSTGFRRHSCFFPL
ncbi:hypothetical protein TNCV_4255361 [Trichonephila clavipes]|nr:hypothetical protein TNCV_4255361 [Trichonephila clavipes]